MIRAAAEARARNEIYVVADMHHMPQLPDARFALAVSYVSLVDIVNLTSALRKRFESFSRAGRFVVCNLSPMVTASRQQAQVLPDHYFDETLRSMPMFGGIVNNFHSTFSTYINGFIEHGIEIEAIREPYPSPEQLKHCPANADNLRVPVFIIYLLRKPLKAR